MNNFLNHFFNISSGSEVENILAIAAGVIFLIISIRNVLPLKQEDRPKIIANTNSLENKIEKIDFKEKLKKGLAKTREEIWQKVSVLISKDGLSEDKLDELEEILYTSDLSPSVVETITQRLKKLKDNEDHISLVKQILFEKMNLVQSSVNKDLYSLEHKTKQLKVIMIVGVNGAGKTTTIGKLATRLKRQGAKVVVGACDTFRAAAVEQLEVWCKRANVEIIKAPENSNPTGVAFDTVKRAVELEADYCIIDTAGRLHTAANLMDELAKTKRVMSKVLPDAPHETLLVIDAITGQNAIKQAKEFNASLSLSGLIFTKCDGSSKAGSAVSVVDELKVPIVYIGVGEDVDDLDVFDLNDYLTALVGQ